MTMRLEEVLAAAREREISRDEALFLFREVREPKQALMLFETGREVRDREIGKRVKLMGFMVSITPCTVDPPCRYCFRWAAPSLFTEEDLMSEEEIARAAQAIAEAGVRHVEIAGGTQADEEGTRATLRAAQAVREGSGLGVWVNNGPSYSPDTVPLLKEIGVEGIACNLETVNHRAFAELRPGDSLARRKELIQATERVGLGIDNTLMIGLGEGWKRDHPYEDWVDFLFYFKGFENFRILEIHPFRPMPGSPVAGLPAGSPFETAKAQAIARLIFRDIDITGADAVAGVMAGANMIMHAVSVSKRRKTGPRVRCGEPVLEDLGGGLSLANYVPAISRYLADLGMELV